MEKNITRKIITSFFAILSVVAICLCSFMQVNAAVTETDTVDKRIVTDEDISEGLQKIDTLLGKMSYEKNEDKIGTLNKLIKEKVSKGDLLVNSKQVELDYNSSKVVNISEEEKTYTSITIPLVGDNYSFASNLTVVFDSSLKSYTYTETALTKSENDFFRVDVFNDGKQIKSEELDIPYLSDSEIKSEISRLTEAQNVLDSNVSSRGVVDKIACIAVILGVTKYIGGIIVSFCAGSCAAGVAPLCVACVGGIVTFGGASLTALIKCFKL